MPELLGAVALEALQGVFAECLPVKSVNPRSLCSMDSSTSLWAVLTRCQGWSWASWLSLARYSSWPVMGARAGIVGDGKGARHEFWKA